MLANKATSSVVSSKDFIPNNLINENTSVNKQKNKRNISHACVNCQKKKCKCIPIENPNMPGKPFCETCKQLDRPYCEFKNQKKRGPSTSDNEIKGDSSSSMIKPDDINIIKGVLNKHKTKGKVSKDPLTLPTGFLTATKLLTPSTSTQTGYFQNIYTNKTNPLSSSIPAFTKPLINKSFENEWIHDNRNIHGDDRKSLQREKSTEKLFEYLLYGYNDLQTHPQDEHKRKIKNLLHTLKKKTVDDIYDDIVALESLLADYLSK
ncbi:hypothetical protein ACO0R3_000211 [Hanseniaspora guilliermondii]